MALVNILHMTIGHEDSSYAKNSLLQVPHGILHGTLNEENGLFECHKIAIQKAIPALRRTIRRIDSHDIFLDSCIKIADLGCSSGPNTLLFVSNIIDLVIEVCKEDNHKTPQFQVCLNDLFGNDFNTLFKLLSDFYAKLKENGENFGPCFVSVVPGSFYARLFPDLSLHLVHSSFSVHWLSQVPEGIENNTLNIYIAKTSPPNVFQAYAYQYRTDFTCFLKMRSKEIVSGGGMVLTFVGRSIDDPTSDDGCSYWEHLAQSLRDLVKEGLVRELDINSFNVPIYHPCVNEVRDVIQNEGSFSLDGLTDFQINWDPNDTDYTHTNDSIELSHHHGRNTAKLVRAITEPLLTSHFGNFNMDLLFNKYEKHLSEHLTKKKTRLFCVVVSLTKK